MPYLILIDLMEYLQRNSFCSEGLKCLMTMSVCAFKHLPNILSLPRLGFYELVDFD